MLEGSVCPNMPPAAPAATPFDEIKEYMDRKGYVDLMASRYEKWRQDNAYIDGFGYGAVIPVRLLESHYAVGVLERIKWPSIRGAGVHVYLRYLEDRRFVLPVVVPDKCEDLRNEAALIGKIVLLHCIVLGEDVNFLTGMPYPRRRYRISPFQVHPEMAEMR